MKILFLISLLFLAACGQSDGNLPVEPLAIDAEPITEPSPENPFLELKDDIEACEILAENPIDSVLFYESDILVVKQGVLYSAVIDSEPIQIAERYELPRCFIEATEPITVTPKTKVCNWIGCYFE